MTSKQSGTWDTKVLPVWKHFVPCTFTAQEKKSIAESSAAVAKLYEKPLSDKDFEKLFDIDDELSPQLINKLKTVVGDHRDAITELSNWPEIPCRFFEGIEDGFLGKRPALAEAEVYADDLSNRTMEQLDPGEAVFCLVFEGEAPLGVLLYGYSLTPDERKQGIEKLKKKLSSYEQSGNNHAAERSRNLLAKLGVKA